MNIYGERVNELYYFLAIYATLSVDDPLRIRKNLLDSS